MSLTSAPPLAARGCSASAAPPARPARPARPLASLSDDDLLRGLSRLLSQSRRIESDLVAHIAEVDERRLWARRAFPSMFAYCTGALGLSESEAYLRIAVGRASHAYPIILRLLAEGRAHLSGIALLAPHLTPVNAERLLARAAFRTKREVEELIAEIAPRPDVRAAVRRLPGPALSTTVPHAEVVGSIVHQSVGDPSSSATVAVSGVSTAATGAVTPAFPGPTTSAAAEPASPLDLLATLSGMGRTVTPSGSPMAPGAFPPPDQARSARQVQPLAPDRYRVQFTASSALVRKIERLSALMSPRFPDGDLAAVIDAAVTEKLERLEARRFGAKPRRGGAGKGSGGRSTPVEPPRSNGEERGVRRSVGEATGRRPRGSGATGSGATGSGATGSGATGSGATGRGPTGRGPIGSSEPPTPPATRHIPASVRRAVFDRDGGRCTYVDASGRRCPERDRLEYHHRHPFGLGGGHRPENLGLLCRAHNSLAAEHDFGRQAMARCRRSGASASRPPPGA